MIFKIVCAWCGKEMGEKKYHGQLNCEKNISHSMCEECLAKEINRTIQLMKVKTQQKPSIHDIDEKIDEL